MASLRGAAARVDGRILWSGVDLDIAAGEFVALLGPNGVGKTTLVKMLLGVLEPAAGKVEVLGERPGRASRHVGYLPQNRSFDPSLRVRGIDIVRLGWDGDRWGVPLPGAARFSARQRSARERIDKVIELVGADSYAHRPIGRCSSGEQQRLLIAQALVRRPRLLLLDEPLDGLDLTGQATVTELIDRIRREEGVSVVLVAHDVNPILRFLDRAVYLAPQGVVAGPADQVVSSEKLTRLYGTPIEVLRTSDGRLVVVGQPDSHAGWHHQAERFDGRTGPEAGGP
ncbi:metal ABC transporter ATP-binding protein [Streptomyces sp. 8N114]|uniref:metal ABC transporter ATP-binding protein n=1 Tax=Streptomyces sp. 8N114 TaxID=3457419 RepID=UPI003FD1A6B2